MAVRVLWLVKGLGPGGAERLLVEAARAHDQSRVQLTCAFVLPWKDHLVAELEAAGVATSCLSSRRSDPRWPLHLRRLLAGGEFDVVHGHSPLPMAVARLVVRTLPRSRRPVTMSSEHNGWATHRAPTRLLNRFTARADSATVAVSAEVKDSMRGPAAARAETLVHGIDVATTARQREHRAAVRAELGIATDTIAVGTVANFREQKDYPNLLAAARLLADRDVPVQIVAIGQGPLEAETRQRCHELGLDDRVLFTGFRADAQRVLGACDVFTLASQWEGLPVALMEALALGLPVVVTSVGGMAETLAAEDDALLVPPRDPQALAAALERVITDTVLRDRLAAASVRRAGEFDVTRATRVLEDTYERIAPRHEPIADQPAPATGTAAAAGSRPAKKQRAAADIRPAQPDDRAAVLDLLRRSLGGDDDPRYADLFAWKHDHNCFGQSPMWVATEADQIISFRAFMRWEFERGGSVLRAVRAVDTATDPDHQGKGLFTALTMHAVREVTNEGIDFVFNTPNDQSRPGYLKMGWREVGRLSAAVRFIGPAGATRALRARVPAERWSSDLAIGTGVVDWLAGGGMNGRLAAPTDVRQLRTRVDDEFLLWRYGTPLLGYRVIDDGDAAVIVRARRRGAAQELVVAFGVGARDRIDRLAARAARQAHADYAIRLGSPRVSTGFAPLPGGGPVLTWRRVNDPGMAPLANWGLTLGDVELF